MIQLLLVDQKVHRSLFKQWVASERINRWWGDPAARLDQFDATPADQHVIIAKDEVAVGYVRWEVVEHYALAGIGLDGIPEGSVDMDIFIGDEECTARGVGPTALELVSQQLKQTNKVLLIGLCTSVDNVIAHRAFEKASFTRWKQFEDEYFGLCWVYIRHLIAPNFQ